MATLTDITPIRRSDASVKVLGATQANSTVTPAVVNDGTGAWSFSIPAGRSLDIWAILVAIAAATTTGLAVGIRVSQPAGANGNAVGAWVGIVNLSSAAAASALTDGDVWNVAAGSNSLGEILGTATTSGNNAGEMRAIIQNKATNAATTVTVEFRSEVAASAVTLQIGSAARALVL